MRSQGLGKADYKGKRPSTRRMMEDISPPLWCPSFHWRRPLTRKRRDTLDLLTHFTFLLGTWVFPAPKNLSGVGVTRSANEIQVEVGKFTFRPGTWINSLHSFLPSLSLPPTWGIRNKKMVNLHHLVVEKSLKAPILVSCLMQIIYIEFCLRYKQAFIVWCYWTLRFIC